ncbi:MAG: BON domain-containing protein [Devosia sp.]|nr:BON domain-containing protein [Devosia sp.]
MRNDHDLQKRVQEQLDCDPAINSSHIGVAVRLGVVTLSGHVPSFGEKRAGEIAAGQVKGVKAIVSQIVVELPGGCQTSDETVAEQASARLGSNKSVPADRVHLSVERGVVTLRGDVDWQYQRQAAEDDLHHLDCIRQIHNEIAIKPPVKVELVRDKVREVLARIAPLDADNISVKIDGSRVTLSGTVNSWHEKGLAQSAVWSVPGVTAVVDDIAVA